MTGSTGKVLGKEKKKLSEKDNEVELEMQVNQWVVHEKTIKDQNRTPFIQFK